MKEYLELKEMVYSKNIGFQEMVEFYKKANKEEIEEMERIIKNGNWKKFKNLISTVLRVNLK